METLVLDRNYMPLYQVAWDCAMRLLYVGKVEVVSEYEDRVVRTVSLTFKLPSIIRFLTGVSGKRKATRYSKSNLYARDKGRCQYCQARVSLNAATIDHVVPRAQGGITQWGNVVIACLSCNSRKGNRTPEQAGMKLQLKPGRPSYLPSALRVTLTKGAVPASWHVYLGVLGG